jgi:RNA polymerase sigma factor (sigma-70 family)
MQKDEQKKAFEKVIQQHKGILFKVARTYCQNQDDRPDLIQEIMIQLWLSFHKYNDDYKITTWIYRISLNVAISFYRKNSIKINDGIPWGEHLSQIAENDRAESEQQLTLLEKFINEFKEIDKALMFLYLEERNYREISEILGISESNVSTKVARIKESLRQKFATIKNQNNGRFETY